MPIIPKLILAAYLLFLMAAGWRLFSIEWSRPLKWATGLSLVVPLPALIALPGLFRSSGVIRDFEIGVGATFLTCGVLSLLAGLALGWLRARRK
jgi:hypothetical protein